MQARTEERGDENGCTDTVVVLVAENVQDEAAIEQMTKLRTPGGRQPFVRSANNQVEIEIW